FEHLDQRFQGQVAVRHGRLLARGLPCRRAACTTLGSACTTLGSACTTLGSWGRRLACHAVRGPLLLIIAGLDELLALQRRDLHARYRSLRLRAAAITLGVLAVGHLQTTNHLRIRDAH